MFEANVFLVVLSLIYLIKLFSTFIMKLFETDPEPMMLTIYEKILFYISLSYVITNVILKL